MIIGGNKTIIQYESATPGTYVSLVQVLAVTPPAMVQKTKDNTNLDDVLEQIASTIMQSPQIKFKVQYDPKTTTHQTLTTMVAAGSSSSKKFKVVFFDSATLANRSLFGPYLGWVQAFEPGETNNDGNVEADITIILTEVPAPTPGT